METSYGRKTGPSIASTVRRIVRRANAAKAKGLIGSYGALGFR
jgi:hypothetical protein